MAPIVDQEFVAHLFAFEDGPRADRAYRQSRGLWAACRDRLGMSVPVTRLGVTDRLPQSRCVPTVVLMTPDDTVRLHPGLAGERDPDHETAVGCQARPNVLVELGMALMAYPERTIVIEIGSLRPVGDLAGLNVIRFDGSGRAIAKVVSRLREAGCPVDDSDTAWKDPSRFAGLDAFTRGPHENR